MQGRNPRPAPFCSLVRTAQTTSALSSFNRVLGVRPSVLVVLDSIVLSLTTVLSEKTP